MLGFHHRKQVGLRHRSILGIEDGWKILEITYLVHDGCSIRSKNKFFRNSFMTSFVCILRWISLLTSHSFALSSNLFVALVRSIYIFVMAREIVLSIIWSFLNIASSASCWSFASYSSVLFKLRSRTWSSRRQWAKIVIKNSCVQVADIFMVNVM